MKMIALAALAAALVAAPAAAQQAQHGQMAKQDYTKAMQDMHRKMMAAEDADPDRAFALKMIEHHRGGVAMSQAVQRHGDDAEIKRMAQKTTEMQQKEIAELQAWLARHGGRVPGR